jgi:putative addiction module antidote
MKAAVKVRKIGNSLGIVFPKKLVTQLKVQEGDVITLTKAPNGFRLTAKASPDLAKKLSVFKSLNRRHRNTLSSFEAVENLCGIIKDGPTDMSTNPKYMKGFGK